MTEFEHRAGDKTFLLGTGCQKGGTSWVHDYVKSSPQFASGYRKEYHIFDALDLESQAYRRTRVLEAAQTTLERALRGGPLRAHMLHQASMYANLEIYFGYFAGLLSSRPDVRLTADVTPAYAMLSSSRMAQIKSEFAQRGVRTVALFLMRDPVDRILSQLRMQIRDKPDRFAQPLPELLLEKHAGGQYAQRTRYDQTISNLDQAFDPGEIYYGFYEDLFSESRIRELCALLGIDFHPPEFNVRTNASPPASAIADEIQRTVAEHYRDVYESVGARFPDADLEALWPSTRLLR